MTLKGLRRGHLYFEALSHITEFDHLLLLNTNGKPYILGVKCMQVVQVIHVTLTRTKPSKYKVARSGDLKVVHTEQA